MHQELSFQAAIFPFFLSRIAQNLSHLSQGAELIVAKDF